MTENLKDSEAIDYSTYPSPREWYRQFRVRPDSRTTDKISLLHPDWNKNAKAREKHPERFGKNNRITIVWLRHGEKNADDTLKPEGVKQAQEEMDLVIANGFDPAVYGLIQPLASYAGPQNRYGLPRAAETAQASTTHMLLKNTPHQDVDPLIYPGMPEYSPEMTYTKMKIPIPAMRDPVYYGAWVEAYAEGGFFSGADLEAARKIVEEASQISDLQARRKRFGELGPILNKADISQEQRLAFVNKASAVTVDALAKLDTPEGINWRNETAGGTSHMLLHYMDVAEKMESGNSAALIAGGHGELNWDWILQQALKWKKQKTGEEQIGFSSFDEIGGPIRPAESIVINITTDKSGHAELTLSFSRKDRPQETLSLDRAIMEKVSATWADLHKDDPKDMTPREYFRRNIQTRGTVKA